MIKRELIYLQMKDVKYCQLWHYFKVRKSFSRYKSVHYLNTQNIWSFKEEKLFKDWDRYQEILSVLEKKVVLFGEKNYPYRWLQLPQPPILFYYKGDLNLLSKPLVAVIGSRKLSAYGRKNAQRISEALTKVGFVIVSGLAKGADYYSHKACMSHKKGKTVAIIANGFEHYYPKEHQQLQNQIARSHLLISEYLPYQSVRKHQFIARNRLVAGLCPVVIVIQAAKKSGSLITANYALDYNSQIYALPGPIDDPQSYGSNHLIQVGARPIVDMDQLIEEMTLDYQRIGYKMNGIH
ncbi:DNA-processing protein DprA [Facklamia sp. 7083-14-GEN3]|uniref:DNA-processing protein DprA n=1 Tax=Facklamia sp. 7083-14-GEN3 TaxID=2973478 RepID=UPI00215D518E|nr:DNA-processing protein DprA [Facklamia sp. 7083-14-GEN3]MCR8968835.1 DNA-processing protein DprA [Facklamia sp. 7083-14-GEN3]